jgi:hypothetical protein
VAFLQQGQKQWTKTLLFLALLIDMTLARLDLRKIHWKPYSWCSRRSALIDEAGCERRLTTSGLKDIEMKRCPTCRQLFAAALKFCRSDGTQLVSELVPLGDAPTILFSTTRISDRFPWLVGESHSTCEEQKSESKRTGGLG